MRREVLTYELSAARVRLAILRLGVLSLKRNFNPNEPRIPAGNRWTREGGGGGWTFIAQHYGKGPFSVNLFEEEVNGGHTIAEHVGKSRATLLAIVRGDRVDTTTASYIRYRDGSFPNVAAANKLVNSTLARNRDLVFAVASGKLNDAFVVATFRSPTGIEAYRKRPIFAFYSSPAAPVIRTTYGVGVYIVHDPGARKGYRVVTAYPRSE